MSAGADKLPSRMSLLPLQGLMVVLAIPPTLFLIMLLVFGFGPAADVPVLGDYMTWTAMAVASAAIIVDIVVSAVLRTMVRRSSHAGGLSWLVGRTIVGALLFIFAAFFASVALMLEQALTGLIIAIFMILGLLAHVPTQAIAGRWSSPQQLQ